jgi:hypothetical protein
VIANPYVRSRYRMRQVIELTRPLLLEDGTCNMSDKLSSHETNGS